jgi:flagellar biosynthesis protein
MKRQSRTPTAVALDYDPDQQQAPMVVASGRGSLAEEIIRLAKEHGVPVRQDPDLVEVLSKLDIGETIPPELYVVVAEVLAFVYKVNAERRAQFERSARVAVARAQGRVTAS